MTLPSLRQRTATLTSARDIALALGDISRANAYRHQLVGLYSRTDGAFGECYADQQHLADWPAVTHVRMART